MHISTLLAFALLALAPSISGQDVPSDAVARRHVGGGSVIARGVVIDLEAREPHHKGKKVKPVAVREPHHKGKKVKPAARDEEAVEELEDRSPEPHHKAASASKAAITITGTGATSLPAKPDGCATITPAGSTAQTVCVKAVTAKGFNMSVKDVATGKKTSCK
ncbi:hypothetical protein VE04_09811, partial [Pseudogymnoascus sp. 24MN13]